MKRAVTAAQNLLIVAAVTLSWIYVLWIIGGMILDERDRKRHERILHES